MDRGPREDLLEEEMPTLGPKAREEKLVKLSHGR